MWLATLPSLHCVLTFPCRHFRPPLSRTLLTPSHQGPASCPVTHIHIHEDILHHHHNTQGQLLALSHTYIYMKTYYTIITIPRASFLPCHTHTYTRGHTTPSSPYPGPASCPVTHIHIHEDILHHLHHTQGQLLALSHTYIYMKTYYTIITIPRASFLPCHTHTYTRGHTTPSSPYPGPASCPVTHIHIHEDILHHLHHTQGQLLALSHTYIYMKTYYTIITIPRASFLPCHTHTYT